MLSYQIWVHIAQLLEYSLLLLSLRIFLKNLFKLQNPGM